MDHNEVRPSFYYEEKSQNRKELPDIVNVAISLMNSLIYFPIILNCNHVN